MIDSQDLQYLKQVSRMKHRILRNYLEPWATILGGANERLGYFDCFAGGGAYVDEQGELLPGSPLIALRLAKEYCIKYPRRSVILGFVEQDEGTVNKLETVLAMEPNIPAAVKYAVFREAASGFTDCLISYVKQNSRSRQIVPSFFFIDPYGHPITLLFSLERDGISCHRSPSRSALSLPRLSTTPPSCFRKNAVPESWH